MQTILRAVLNCTAYGPSARQASEAYSGRPQRAERSDRAVREASERRSSVVRKLGGITLLAGLGLAAFACASEEKPDCADLDASECLEDDRCEPIVGGCENPPPGTQCSPTFQGCESAK
jgi:hypothetical protein